MRVAMYHATLPGGRPGKEGGVTYVVHRLANVLVGRGHAVTMFSFDQAPSDALYDMRILPLRRWADPPPGRMVLAPLILSSRDLRGFDVMHAHGDDHLVIRHMVPWVRTLYGSARRERESAVRLRRKLSQAALVPLEKLAVRRADVAVGISQDTAVCIPGIDEIIPCGADLSVFRPSHGPRSAAPSILFVGGVHGRKRGALLLDLFEQQIRPVLPDAELWMVCDPEAARPGIHWCGKVSTEELVRLYQQAWTFCLPSSYEGFGIPYVEAMACGTPVVATANPGAHEILDGGRFGALVGDDELACALLALLRDAAQRERYSRLGLERAADYHWDRIAARYEQVYEQACRVAHADSIASRHGIGDTAVPSTRGPHDHA